MIAKNIELSILNKFMVLLATLFVIAAGIFAIARIPLDAIPDLSDAQVIIFTEFPGQAPQVVEDQVTYPLTTAMLAVPYAKVVRGYSFFGLSFVYVIFEDGTDLYWARSRVLEYLNFVSGRLPQGVTPSLGPDATGVGWVYEYTLESDRHDLAQLRSIQDWFLRYELTSVPGVAEVASIGGYVKQYQVIVDPNRLRAFNIPLQMVRNAIQRSNRDVGGRLVEMGETEFMVRGLGYIKNIDDLYNIPLKVDDQGTPVLLRNVATVKIGPELRRGLADNNGEGETVGGVIVMRYGENALKVIENVKQRLHQLEASLPAGVHLRSVYDRSGLILRAVHNLKHTLIEESLIVALVCILFLVHFRSALVGILTLPLGVFISFIIMSAVGGMNITQTVEGQERYPVNLRYGSELRDTPEKLRRILVPTPLGAQIPIGQLADIRIVKGPPVVKSENARHTAWVYVDIKGIDVGSFVKAAQQAVSAKVNLPPGYSLLWSGQYEYMVRAQKRLMIVVPMTLIIIFVLLYFNLKTSPRASSSCSACPLP